VEGTLAGLPADEVGIARFASGGADVQEPISLTAPLA
jgi:hypothetical protein